MDILHTQDIQWMIDARREWKGLVRVEMVQSETEI